MGGNTAPALGEVPRQVQVGPFRVLDASARQTVSRVLELADQARERPVTVFALHVGGLNARGETAFVDAMREADMVYADGGSVVWLAKLAGAASIERAPTTDVGWDILKGLAARLGRDVRVSLIGGPPGLAERAAAALASGAPVEIVSVHNGFHSDWERPLAEVRDARPDITIVGLGAPREMMWCREWREHLPNSIVLTCGGWFGHLVGDERRAPTPLRRSGLEWIARMAQDPVRLGPRYARGVASTVSVARMIRQRGPSE